jgi:hypothetical protein
MMKKGFSFGILIKVFLSAIFMLSFVDVIRIKSKVSEDETVFAIPLADVITLDENKITPNIDATSLDCEYDGLPHYINATIDHGLQDRLVIIYRNDIGEVITDPIIPGTYVVDISFEGDETYNAVAKSVGLTIKKAEFKNVSLPDLTFDYDGLAHNLTVSGAPEGTTAVFDKVDLIDAGKYQISVRISKLYYNDQTLTGYLTINKVTPTITGSNAEAVYDGLHIM